jgi:hypothetical protein
MSDVIVYGSEEECSEIVEQLSATFPQWEITTETGSPRKIEVYSRYLSVDQLQEELDELEHTTSTDAEYSQTAILLQYSSEEK